MGERYRIQSHLSKGGMGAVYRAQHIVLDKPLALKIMLQTQDEAARQRFLQEAKLASVVRHPNIVDIVDFGVLDTRQPYLVMELLEGKTLADVIAHEPLSPARVCLIAGQIARGLAAVHDKGIIHRDLKPANIFLVKQPGRTMPGGEPDDLVKIVDFGIATMDRSRIAGSPEGMQARLTVPGMVMGTAEYMSPEQAQGLPTDARVDQYALGCILYEMLTGQVPYQGASPAATMMKHITSRPAVPSSVRPDRGIPPALEALVDQAMAREPADRFASMSMLEQQLVDLYQKLTGQAPTARVPHMDTATPRDLLLRLSKKHVLAVGAGLLGILILGLAGWRWSHPRPLAQQDGMGPRNGEQRDTVQWQIITEPSGALVVRVRDKKILGQTPWQSMETRGDSTVEVELQRDGYVAASLRLDAGRDEVRKVQLLPQTSGTKQTVSAPTKGTTVGTLPKKKQPKRNHPVIRDNRDVKPLIK